MQDRAERFSATDVLIAALARVHDTRLLHCDAHYDRLAELDEGGAR